MGDKTAMYIGGNKMKKLFFGTLFLALAIVVSIPTMAGAMGRVDVGVSIPLPPPIRFAGPPALIVLPETYVYAVPDIDVDIFFYSGWWWRPWEGRWYRSQYYNSGWGYYQGSPSFYVGIPSGWRNDYREHRWRGHEWNYQRIPHQQVQQNWDNWEKNKHWEKQNTWGVQGLKPQPQSQKQSQVVQPQQHRPQSHEFQPQQSRPQHMEAPQQPGPQSQAKPEVREAAKPQQSRPQSHEFQPQQHRPQHMKAPQQSKPQHGKHERGQEEEHDRR